MAKQLEVWSRVNETRVTAQVRRPERADEGHTVFVIEVAVHYDGVLVRTWLVRRRYKQFQSLYRSLKQLDFPCPELPPRRLWALTTRTFIRERQNALDLWLQGTLCIWQSVSVLTRHAEQEFAIVNLLECFLCDTRDSADGKRSPLSRFGTSPMAFGSTPDDGSASLLSASPDTQASADSYLERKPTMSIAEFLGSSPTPTAMHKFKATPARDVMATTSRVRRTRTDNGVSSAAFSFDGRAKMGSDGVRSGESLENEPRRRSNSIDLSVFSFSADSRRRAPAAPAAKDLSLQKQNVRVPFKPQSLGLPPQRDVRIDVGVAVSTKAEQGSRQPLTYTTFDRHGQEIRYNWRPFTTTVRYDSERADSHEGRMCTPVSVPPTPGAQMEFFSAWGNYTSSILDYVADRLHADDSDSLYYDSSDGMSDDGSTRLECDSCRSDLQWRRSHSGNMVDETADSDENGTESSLASHLSCLSGTGQPASKNPRSPDVFKTLSRRSSGCVSELIDEGAAPSFDALAKREDAKGLVHVHDSVHGINSSDTLTYGRHDNQNWTNTLQKACNDAEQCESLVSNAEPGDACANLAEDVATPPRGMDEEEKQHLRRTARRHRRYKRIAARLAEQLLNETQAAGDFVGTDWEHV